MRGRYPITVSVLDPIYPGSFEGQSVAEFAASVRSTIADHIGEKQPVPVELQSD